MRCRVHNMSLGLFRFMVAWLAVFSFSTISASDVNAACVVGDLQCVVDNTIVPVLSSIGSQTTTILSNTGTTLTKTGQSLTATLNIKNTLDSVNTIRTNLETVSSQVQDMMAQGKDLLEYYQQNDLVELNEFLGGGSGCAGSCIDFREQLITLTLAIEDSTNAILEISTYLNALPNGTLPRIDFPGVDLSVLRGALEGVPGFVLFPIYKAFNISKPGEAPSVPGSSPHLQAIIDSLTDATAAVNALPDNPVMAFHHCDTMMDPGVKQLLTEIKTLFLISGGFTKLVGKLTEALGIVKIKEVQAGGSFGAHVTATIESDAVATIGKIVVGIGDLGIQIANSMTSSIRHCEIVVLQQRNQCLTRNIYRMLKNRSEIDCSPSPLFTLPDQGW